MKKIASLSLLVLLACGARAQTPSIGPIEGPAVLCSSPASPGTFSAVATNNPQQYNWSIVPSAGVQFSSYNTPVVSVIFPPVTKTYTIYCSASNIYGSSPTVTKVVTIYETPTVTFSGSNLSICNGASASLMASPTTQASSSTLSFAWSPATWLNSVTGPAVVATPPVNTTYTVVVSLGICSHSYFLPVSIVPAPSLSVTSNNNPMCVGESATLSIVGDASYYLANSASSTLNFTISPASTFTYNIIGVAANGCETEWSFVQNVGLCLSMQNSSRTISGLTVYPNPSNGRVTLKSEAARRVTVINQLGQTIRNIEISPDFAVEITDLSEGMYFLVSGTESYRLIITR